MYHPRRSHQRCSQEFSAASTRLRARQSNHPACQPAQPQPLTWQLRLDGTSYSTALPYRHTKHNKSCRQTSNRCKSFAQEESRPSNGQKWLEQLELANSGNPSQRQPTIPGEKSQEHTKDGNVGQP